MVLKILYDLSDNCGRYWKLNFYEGNNRYPEYYGSAYYDLETRKLYDWAACTTGRTDEVKIKTNGGRTFYVLVYDGYIPSKYMMDWWNKHEGDREEFITKAIVDSLI